jgi:hypothetical protein
MCKRPRGGAHRLTDKFLGVVMVSTECILRSFAVAAARLVHLGCPRKTANRVHQGRVFNVCQETGRSGLRTVGRFFRSHAGRASFWEWRLLTLTCTAAAPKTYLFLYSAQRSARCVRACRNGAGEAITVAADRVTVALGTSSWCLQRATIFGGPMRLAPIAVPQRPSYRQTKNSAPHSDTPDLQTPRYSSAPGMLRPTEVHVNNNNRPGRQWQRHTQARLLHRQCERTSQSISCWIRGCR